MSHQAERTVSLLQHLMRDAEDVRALLAPAHLTVSLDCSIAANPQAQLIFSFAANLAARLEPIVQELQLLLPMDIPLTCHPPRWRARTVGEHIRSLLQALQPPLRWTIAEVGADARGPILAIGPSPGDSERTVSIGSDGWIATIVPGGAAPIGVHLNPVGAYAAACLGVAEVCKRLLFPHRARLRFCPIVPLEAALSFSTFSYRTGGTEPNPTLDPRIDIHRLTLVGLGAGGGATAFTLASLPNSSGHINLIEPDEVVLSNLNRYVFADLSDIGRPKTGVVEAMLRAATRITTSAFTMPFSEAATKIPVADYRYTIAAVHSREARRQLQHETPRVLWDMGATETGEFHLWRMVLGQVECMQCKHPPHATDPERTTAEQLARTLGLDVERWFRLLRDNAAFTQSDVNAMSHRLQGKGLQDASLPKVGQHYGDWWPGQCGRIQLPELDDELPIPFAPVMAGVLIAGEVIKEHYFPEVVLQSRYWNALLGQFLRRMTPQQRFPRADCRFCHDPHFLDQYHRRWSCLTGPTA